MNHLHLSPVSPTRSHIVKATARQRVLPLLIVASLFFACAMSHTQAQGPQDNDSAKASTPTNSDKTAEQHKPMEGIWPTPKLMKSVLRRWAHRVGDRYELDQDQREQVEKAVIERWTGFLTEHRQTIQPLFNEFLELRMEVEPPEKDSVIAWAQQAEHAFDMVREELTRATQDVREVLTPRQRFKFETDMLAFGGGLELAKQRLNRIKRGDFEPNEFWTPTAPERRKRRRERLLRREKSAELATNTDQQPSEILDVAVDQIMAELNRWQEYVTEFISLYELNEGQRTTAVSCLRELSQRALDHRKRHYNDIDQLERRILENTSSDEELEQINNDLVKLYGPIDDLFTELQTRLGNIPTARQRELASKSTAKAQNQFNDRTQDQEPGQMPKKAKNQALSETTNKPSNPQKPSNPPPPLPRGD